MNKGFPNFAGIKDCDLPVSQELALAGIDFHILPITDPSSLGLEVPTRVMGSIAFTKWRFERAWRYWVARGPGIPLEQATKLHEEFGQEVRVDGHCGCPSPLEWYRGFPVDHYHVDTPAGLKALADTIKKISTHYNV